MVDLYPKISYSALERFERCQMAYRLRREGKRKKIDPKFVLDGNAMHAGLEAIVLGIPEDPVEHALGYWSMRLREDAVRWTREEKQEHFVRVRDGMRKLVDLVPELTEGAEVSSEVRLVHVGKGWAMEGIIDLWSQKATGVEVWDLKTGRWHLDQLVFYDLLVEQAVGYRPAVTGIIEVFGKGAVRQPVDESHRQDMRERMRAMVVAVREGRFETDGYSARCSWCDSKPWCPRWDAARSGSLEA